MNLSTNQGIIPVLTGVLLLGLVVSPFLNGLSQILLLILLFLSIPKSLKPFIQDRNIQIFGLFFLILIISMFYSENLNYALKDLRIKSSFLLFPFVFAVFGKIKHKIYLALLWTLTFGATIAAFAGIYKYFQHPDLNMRDYSVFISHIRFSYIIAAILIFHFVQMIENKKVYSFYTILPLGILLFMLFFLSSLSAIFAFLVSGLFLFWTNFHTTKTKVLIILIISIPILYSAFVLYNFIPKQSFESQIKKYQLSGNENYFLRVKAKENSYYTGLQLNELEIKTLWPKISLLSGESLENSYFVLIRYMTSKGLAKDSIGLQQLSPSDIKNIKNGFSNYIFVEKNHFYQRLYTFFWEIDRYLYNESPQGHSFTQRFIFWKAAAGIIAQNPVLGAGIGDLNDAFQKYYAQYMPNWPEHLRKKTHNQFLAFMVSNGILGGLLLILALYWPFFLSNKNKRLQVILLLMSISMLTEDTFETQAGATFFAFFYSMFLYADFEDRHSLLKKP